MSNLTKEQQLKMYQSKAPKELVESMEGLIEGLSDYVDIMREPSAIYENKILPIVTDMVMESVQGVLPNDDYENGAVVYLESMTEDETERPVAMEMADLHQHNLRQLMENSGSEFRTAHPNQRGLNELTPFDAFLPFVIIRSYLPLVAKDVVPYITPKQPFIRIKEQYKYIVTKDNQRFLRPDVYRDYDTVSDILASAKGKEVIQDWLPAGTEVKDEGAFDYEADGKKFTLPKDGVKITNYDILAESGGIRNIGDALDIDVHIKGARGQVTNKAGKTYMVESVGLEAYPDITSTRPQRSVSARIKYPVKDSDGNIESYVEDTLYGDYNHTTESFNVISLTGVTKQIQFGGHLSNKNNMEYISYSNEFNVYTHPIEEGFSSNVPITVQDMQLYNETSSLDIIANSINEMTEMFTELEDTSVFKVLDDEREKWEGVKEHPFIHFQKGPVVFRKEVSVAYGANRLLKRNQFVQDEIQYALSRFIGEVRDTCQNEPFRIVMYAHPNICSLFVGDNIDWKITPGTSIAEGIRSDYNMGIYTANGDSIRLVSSLKFRESDGIRFLVFPVNEENFLTWKHFKYSLYFDRDHRIKEMPNNPNILGISRFKTKSYVPLQGTLVIKDYK